MMHTVMLTGVGGEGVLTSGAIIAKAAQAEGYFVRGLQLHGLAQRGGTIPTFVRFGKKEKVHSPGIMQAGAELILAFEPLEAVRATYYANKDKTTFIINDWPYIPIYSNLLNLPYPNIKDIEHRVKPFSKKTIVFGAHDLALKHFGNALFGNSMLLGLAVGSKALPLKETTIKESIKSNIRYNTSSNIEAFEMGLKKGKK